MGFVVLHMERRTVPTAERPPIERFIIPKNADPTRTHLNRSSSTIPMGERPNSSHQHRLENAGLTRKIGNNQVQAIRIIVSGTHGDMERIEKTDWTVVCRQHELLCLHVPVMGRILAALHQDERHTSPLFQS